MKRVTVVFEDETLLVLNKPSGLPVQGGSKVAASLDVLLSKDYSPAPLLVHRLDQETSGLILTAKTKDAAAEYSRLLREGRVEKRYTALCAGAAPDRGHIRETLSIKGRDLPAETAYVRTAQGTLPLPDKVPCSLLEITPSTGRMHQIRRHLAGRALPIVGDSKYGDFPLNKALRKAAGLQHLLLHASGLSVPRGGGCLILSAPLPEHFIRILEASGIAPCITPHAPQSLFKIF
jgi:23S rRNA pseudouridine955/2504/2580 synthase